MTMEKIRLYPLLLKSVLLFVLFNFIFVFLWDVPLGKLSLYNVVIPGRERFPFGENPRAYNMSLFNVDAMFAAHVLNGIPRSEDEYRVFLIGDSSVWGTLLTPEQTLAGRLNAKSIPACGKTARVYNLGYPYISLLQELMILDQGLRYQPDMVIWLATLESFPEDKQLTAPLVANNPDRVRDLIFKYELNASPNDPALIHPSTWDQTLAGRRRSLADLFRLQMYGVLWAATGIDQYYPATYEPAQTDFEEDYDFHGLKPSDALDGFLAFDILDAGLKAAGVPTILVNEPILVSNGRNSDIRYNFFYPRWAYDEYRNIIDKYTAQENIPYLDLWNIVPENQFTNSSIHLTPHGEGILADQVGNAIVEYCSK